MKIKKGSKSFTSTDPASHKGKTDTWLTPIWIIKSLGDDFDLDPCGFPDHITAKTSYILPYSNGLEKEWFGKVWLNPPYSEANLWLDKMIKHGWGSTLIFSRTDVFGYYMTKCDHIFLLRKRVKFLDQNFQQSKKNPGCASMILSWGHQDFSKLAGHQIK